MLRRIRVRGFKSAVDVSLDLGRLNVLVGPNASGKTNLLEAVGLIGCAASGRVEDDAFRARGVRLGTQAMYKTALKAEKRMAPAITLEAASDGALYRVSLGNPVQRRATAHARASWGFTSETFEEEQQEIGFRSARKGSIVGTDGKKQRITPVHDRGIGPVIGPMRGEGEITALLRALDGFAIYTPLPPMLRAQLPDPAQKLPLGLMGGGLAEGLFSLQRAGAHGPALRSRFDRELFTLMDWIDGVTFSAAGASPVRVKGAALAEAHIALRLRDRFLRSGVNWLSAVEANDGALFVVFLLMVLFHPAAPRVLAIDNIDQALQPRLARYLLERVQAIVLAEPERPQLLVTTHNPLVLDALDLKDDRVRLFTVSRDASTGATSVRRITHPDARAKTRQRDEPLSQLWLSGALEGVPAL